MSFIRRLRRSRQHRVSILSAYLVHPFPLRGTSPQGETRALRDWFSVSYGMISILVISRYAAPPYPAAPDFPPSGDRINHSMLSYRDMAPLLSTHSAPACGGKVVAPATKGGMPFRRPQGGCVVWFPPPKAAFILAPQRAPYLASAAILYNSRGREPSNRL